jgi:hypothetical protein
MQVHSETDDITIDLTDSKNIHITKFNRSYFELFFDFEIDLFQGIFPILDTNRRPTWLLVIDAWTDWKTIPALVDIAKITYLFIVSLRFTYARFLLANPLNWSLLLFFCFYRILKHAAPPNSEYVHLSCSIIPHE